MTDGVQILLKIVAKNPPTVLFGYIFNTIEADSGNCI